jgi:hypothetical protein
MTSYSATKKRLPLGPATIRFQTVDLNPNAEINIADNTWDWNFKVSGAYNLPYDVLVSASLDHRAGDPFARQHQLTGGRTIPRLVVNVEPLSTRRMPNTNVASLRLQKNFRFLNNQQLSARADLYNLLNANTPTASFGRPSLNARSGASFLRPFSVLPPRTAEFSLQYTF